MTNHIIQEVRDARAALAAEHGYDHRKIFEWAKAAHATRQIGLSEENASVKAPIVEARESPHKIEKLAVAAS